MVVSFVPGRIRLRFKELKIIEAAERVKARVVETPGITKVEINSITGSILVEYDPTVLSTEKLIETGKRELARLGIKLDLPYL